MAYRTAGDGHVVVLLHGNPTSSYLWRHVVPRLAPMGRVIAPDLMGMGGSEPVADSGPGSYRLIDHRAHLDGLPDLLVPDEPLVLVGHDWGGVLAFDWARRHALRVRGIAYTETIVRPRQWADEPPDGQVMFRALHGPDGDQMVLDENFFIERVLAAATELSEEDLAVYRAPFEQPGERRRPMLTFAREIPFDGEPADVHDEVAANAAWLMSSTTAKLFVAAMPGAIITGDVRSFCERAPNQQTVEVAAGHFVPEDAPDELGDALASWLGSLP
jgi:haloalkane dehalogenase